jgi:O-antigen/teichoic acid export membrane protein
MKESEEPSAKPAALDSQAVGELDELDPEAVRDRDLRQLARQSGLNLAGSFVAAALNVVLPILITRNLPKGEAGVFFQATALFTVILTMSTLGADTGLVRFLPRAIAHRRPHDVRETLKISVGPALAFSILLGILLVLTSGPLGEVATGDSDHLASTFSQVIVVLGVVLPVATVYLLGLSASRGFDAIMPLVVIEKIGRGGTQVVVCTAVLMATTSVLLLTLAWSAPYLAALVVVAFWTLDRARKVMANLHRRGDPQPPEPGLAGEFWRFSTPRAVSRLFSVALQRIDIVLIGALRGPADAALYTAATRFPILGLMFVQAIQQVMAPKISVLLALGARDRALTLYQTTTAWLILVSWPIFFGSVAFAPLFLQVVGDGYESAAAAVVILCLTMLVATACGPVDSVLLMGGRSGLSLLNTGLALLAMVVLDFALIPTYGVTGAAIAWMVGILINNLLPLWQVHAILHMQPFGVATRYAILLCTGVGLTLVAIAMIGGQDLLTLIAAAAIGGLVFALGLWRWKQQMDLHALSAVVRRRRRRRR